MYLIHPNARHETMKLQNMCRRYVIVDRWYAIRGAIAMAGEDDVVLICGKGHEDYIARREQQALVRRQGGGDGRAAEDRHGAGGWRGHDQHPVGAGGSHSANAGNGNVLDS